MGEVIQYQVLAEVLQKRQSSLYNFFRVGPVWDFSVAENNRVIESLVELIQNTPRLDIRQSDITRVTTTQGLAIQEVKMVSDDRHISGRIFYTPMDFCPFTGLRLATISAVFNCERGVALDRYKVLANVLKQIHKIPY